VHAHDFSHACSISIPWSSRLSQRLAALGLEGLALGRELRVRQDDDFSHG
jgi:hypothetical protein